MLRFCRDLLLLLLVNTLAIETFKWDIHPRPWTKSGLITQCSDRTDSFTRKDQRFASNSWIPLRETREKRNDDLRLREITRTTASQTVSQLKGSEFLWCHERRRYVYGHLTEQRLIDQGSTSRRNSMVRVTGRSLTPCWSRWSLRCIKRCDYYRLRTYSSLFEWNGLSTLRIVPVSFIDRPAIFWSGTSCERSIRYTSSVQSKFPTNPSKFISHLIWLTHTIIVWLLSYSGVFWSMRSNWSGSNWPSKKKNEIDS